MKVGDYVRTNNGIIGTLYGSYAYDENQLAILTKSNENGVKYTRECLKDDIIKSSPNIIDLIEVGDYVNGMEVTRICFDEDNQRILNLSNCILELMNEDIKSVVTKEQFESMEYKVGEE